MRLSRYFKPLWSPNPSIFPSAQRNRLENRGIPSGTLFVTIHKCFIYIRLGRKLVRFLCRFVRNSFGIKGLQHFAWDIYPGGFCTYLPKRTICSGILDEYLQNMGNTCKVSIPTLNLPPLAFQVRAVTSRLSIHFRTFRSFPSLGQYAGILETRGTTVTFLYPKNSYSEESLVPACNRLKFSVVV